MALAGKSAAAAGFTTNNTWELETGVDTSRSGLTGSQLESVAISVSHKFRNLGRPATTNLTVIRK